MKKLAKNISLLILTFAASVSLLSCGGDNQASGQTSTNGVIIQQGQVAQGSILCENIISSSGGQGTDLAINSTSISNTSISNDGADLVIDGGGGDCISAIGNCTVSIDAKSITLTNCGRCIDAEGEAEVTLTSTNGDISCDAIEDGVGTKGKAMTSLIARDNGNITVNSTEGNGVRAEGDSIVEFKATGKCTIQGRENAIRRDATARVNTAECTKLKLIGNVTIDK